MAGSAGSIRCGRAMAAAWAMLALLASGSEAAAQSADRTDASDGERVSRLLPARTAQAEGQTEQDDVFDEPIEEDAAQGGEPLGADLPEPLVLQAEPDLSTAGLDDGTQGRALAAKAEGEVTDPESDELPQARSNRRAEPVEKGTARQAEDDPFLPIGFRAGTWIVFTRLEAAIGYATNTAFSAGGKPGAFATADGSLIMQSDWSRHQAQLEFASGWRRGFNEDDVEIPTANAAGQLRLDLLDGYTATLRAGYGFATEAASAPALSSGVVNRPGVHSIAASGELARTGGRLEMTLRGSLDRTVYDDAALTGGGTLAQTDRNNSLVQVSARLGYSTGGALTPFVQAGIGRRIHDLAVDRNGDRRDATLYDLRAGIASDFGEKLTGEAAIGYLAQRYDGDLETLDAISFNAAIDWSPERDTAIRLAATTGLSGATTAGNNGYVNYGLSLEAQRRVRDHLALSGRVAMDLSRADWDGAIERTTTLSTGFEYWLNRFLSFTGRLEYQRLDSDSPDNSYDSSSARLGMAWRR